MRAATSALRLVKSPSARASRSLSSVIRRKSAGHAHLDGEPVKPGQLIAREGMLRWGKKDYRRLTVRV